MRFISFIFWSTSSSSVFEKRQSQLLGAVLFCPRRSVFAVLYDDDRAVDGALPLSALRANPLWHGPTQSIFSSDILGSIPWPLFSSMDGSKGTGAGP